MSNTLCHRNFQSHGERPSVPRARGGVLLAVCYLVFSGPPFSRAAAATPQEIERSINGGRNFLFQTETQGNWETVPLRDDTDHTPASTANAQYGGLTALATFALLEAGTNPQDVHIQDAVHFLRTARIDGTYALGVRCQVWKLLPAAPWLKQIMSADRESLLNALHTKGDGAGLYSYYLHAQPDHDHSVSQFGVLGMLALAQLDVEVPTGYWRMVDQAWRRQQYNDGGWSYFNKPSPSAASDPGETLSMTAAGLATLFATQEFTNVTARMQGNLQDPVIDKGLDWIGAHLANGQPTDLNFYMPFGISRIGLASGYKTLGGVDWFQWGADQLVHSESPDGSWHAGQGKLVNVSSTAFAMLFLARGRVPVMLNKLRYDVVADIAKTSNRDNGSSSVGNWNQRPRDAANLAEMVGREIERSLAWQVVSLDNPIGLHDAPILYMAGDKAPKLSTANQARLKKYLEEGGLLLANADGGSLAFSAGFRQLGQQLFPGQAFRPLPPGHVIFTGENFRRSSWSTKPTIEGLTNGTRELMLLIPNGDPAKYWQSKSFPGLKHDTWGQLLIDIFLYAVDKQQLRFRDETYLVSRDTAQSKDRDIELARIKYAGNWDPEPGGWRRLVNALHNDRKINLNVQTVEFGKGQLSEKVFPIASLTICDSVPSTSDVTNSELKHFVQTGGTLLIDSAGGHSSDYSAATRWLAATFPDAKADPPILPPDSPIYSAGSKIETVSYRSFASDLHSTHVPRLRGFRSGQGMVLFSPEDVSVGLVGEPVDGISGYTPSSALQLVENIISYAAKS